MTLIAEYPRKHLADFTAADREAARRYDQGKAHWKQGRYDLLGECEHYDAGWEAADYDNDIAEYDRRAGIA